MGFSKLRFLGMSVLIGAFGIQVQAQDGGGRTELKKITVAYVADTHAQLQEHPELFWSEGTQEQLIRAGGFARLAGALEKMKKENPEGFLFFDAGDTIQGSGEAVLSQGQVMVPILKALNIDLAIPGNWEVVYGTQQFKKIASQLNYPMVAANIFDEKTGERVFPAYHIFERKGVRVAVLGYTDPDVPSRQPPSYSRGFTYKGDEILQPFIDELRREKKADVVILLSHIGLPKAVELSSRLKEVDLHLSGDTHERTYTPIAKNHWVVEAGAFGSFLGRMDITVGDHKVVDKKWELVELRHDRFPESQKMKDLIRRETAAYRRKLAKIIGKTASPLYRYEVNQTSLDMVLSDAIKEAAGTEIALSNGFRFAPPVMSGPLTERDLWSFYPINNQLRVGKVSGAQLMEFWEREIENVYSPDARKQFGGWLPRPSGMTIRFKVNAPKNQRVVEILVGGIPLKKDQIYTIAACAREGDPNNKVCRIPEVIEPKDLAIDVHEAVRRYLKKHKPVESRTELRVVADDLPQPVRSQYYRK